MNRILVLVAGAMILSRCATPLTNYETRGVRAVIDNRMALDRQVIVVNGFLSRDSMAHGRALYFVSPGAPKLDIEPEPHGEDYLCSDEAYPDALWFSDQDLRGVYGGNDQAVTGLPKYPNGRRVILRGVLYNETPVSPTPEEQGLPVGLQSLALEQVGPLREVEILAILDERCDQW